MAVSWPVVSDRQHPIRALTRSVVVAAGGSLLDTGAAPTRRYSMVVREENKLITPVQVGGYTDYPAHEREEAGASPRAPMTTVS